MGAKAFKFKLQPVLAMRMRELEKVQQVFGQQQQCVIRARDLCDQVRNALVDARIPAPGEAGDPTLSNQRFRYIQYLRMQSSHAAERLRREEIALERIREEMRQAHVKKRSLELLEEKQRKAFIIAMSEAEAKETEDLVMARRHLAL